MTSISSPTDHAYAEEGLRPVHLRTDLAPLADLIERVFASTMDDNGRAAIREMRYLSKLGIGVNILTRLNDLALGISLGFVWIEDGRLVGNVSIYPANWPRGIGPAWIIANVGVHPDYQRRGIARQLMHASVEMIRQRGGKHAILQVDADNHGAKNLYDQLGFVTERTWTTWRLSSMTSVPDGGPKNVFITHPGRGEWRTEYELAKKTRANEQGGIAWLKPLHPDLFAVPLWKRLTQWFTLSGMERLIVREPDGQDIAASLWIERSGLASLSVNLTLMTDPRFQGLYDEALIATAVRRFRGQTLNIEHPADETATSEILSRYRFTPRRTVTHMRWDG